MIQTNAVHTHAIFLYTYLELSSYLPLCRNYLRAAVGAMKTTPTEALEVALYQAPLDLAAIETAGLTAQTKMSG